MDRRAVSSVLMTAGVILGIVAALADRLGFVQGRGFGWTQGVGAAAGLMLVAMAWYVGREPRGRR